MTIILYTSCHFTAALTTVYGALWLYCVHTSCMYHFSRLPGADPGFDQGGGPRS